MAYDSRRGVTVLFGGVTQKPKVKYVADTWEWNGKDWKEIHPKHSPPLWLGRHGLRFQAGAGRPLWWEYFRVSASERDLGVGRQGLAPRSTRFVPAWGPSCPGIGFLTPERGSCVLFRRIWIHSPGALLGGTTLGTFISNGLLAKEGLFRLGPGENGFGTGPKGG